MLSVEHFVTTGQLAKAMEHFSEAAAQAFGKDLIYELAGRWKLPNLRLFLSAMDDELRSLEREASEDALRVVEEVNLMAALRKANAQSDADTKQAPSNE